MIAFTCEAFHASTFPFASVWNRYSLPSRRALSPLQISALPRIAKEIFAWRRILTSARLTFFAGRRSYQHIPRRKGIRTGRHPPIGEFANPLPIGRDDPVPTPKGYLVAPSLQRPAESPTETQPQLEPYTAACRSAAGCFR